MKSQVRNENSSAVDDGDVILKYAHIRNTEGKAAAAEFLARLAPKRRKEIEPALKVLTRMGQLIEAEAEQPSPAIPRK